MSDPLIDGVIRKLWIDRAGPYRDHLLRLDADSRRNRSNGRGQASGRSLVPPAGRMSPQKRGAESEFHKDIKGDHDQRHDCILT